MICSSSSPPIRRRPGEGRGPRGFTLVELLLVILILAVLIALLLPALNGALKTARNAAVGAEINQLAQALASFKARYGDYPPSRIYLSEDGNLLPSLTGLDQRQRRRHHLRATGPAVGRGAEEVLSEGGLQHSAPRRANWYDFNGDGSAVTSGNVTQHYILQGHECLVFFLGGIPV